MKNKSTYLLVLPCLLICTFLFSAIFFPHNASAHRSGCHRWHSCPSDSGSYVCGDLGYSSGCPQTNTRTKKTSPPKKKKPSKRTFKQFTGEVVRVLDGDTIKVKTSDKTITVRLAGIDCPEKKQEYGGDAWQFTLVRAASQIVTVETINIDKYGRTIGDITLQNGKNLSQELLKAGLAWWYKKYSTDTTLQKLEKHARTNKIGLWKNKNPTPPWKFRSNKF